MKHYRIFLVFAVLVLTSLACQAITAGQETPQAPSGDGGPTNTTVVPTTSSDSGDNAGGGTSNSGFPLTADAYNIIDAGDGSLIFFTKLSLEEVVNFYRDEYTSKGYTERELLTVITDGTLNMVFDGDPSGKAIVIQSTDLHLGDGSRSVAIRLEDVN